MRRARHTALAVARPDAGMAHRPIGGNGPALMVRRYVRPNGFNVSGIPDDHLTAAIVSASAGDRVQPRTDHQR
jgi:hypothetical protein